MGLQVLIINNTEKKQFFHPGKWSKPLERINLTCGKCFSVTDACCALQYSYMLHLNKIKDFRGPLSALEMGSLSGISHLQRAIIFKK